MGRLKEIKQLLRTGKRLKINKSKSLENIKSAYTQQKHHKNAMDALLLAPIVESDKDEIDLMIDQILTEDVCTISMQPLNEISDAKEEESIEMKKIMREKKLSPVHALKVREDMPQRMRFVMDV